MKKYIITLNDIAPEIASSERVIEYAKHRIEANPEEAHELNLQCSTIFEAIRTIETFDETVTEYADRIIASFVSIEDAINIAEHWDIKENGSLKDLDTTLHFSECDISIEHYTKVAGDSFFLEEIDEDGDIRIKGVFGTFPAECCELSSSFE